MKRALMVPLPLVASILLFTATGCGTPTTDEVQAITTAAVGVGFGLWAQQNPTLATSVAAQVNAGATDALNYLQGSPTSIGSDILNQEVIKRLTANLPPEVQAVIQAAAGILDTVLPAPAPGTYLTVAQIAYITAVVKGVQSGTNLVGAKKVIDGAAGVTWKNGEFSGKWVIGGKSRSKTIKAGKWLNQRWGQK
jgi:hypothetical protein